MNRGFTYVGVLAFLVVALVPAAAFATAPNNESASYEFELEVPNVGMAPNGDTIAVTGGGFFSVHPKSASGRGSFTHTFAGGGSVSGTWTATDLVDFQPYGCGVIFGEQIPANFCGGRVALRVVLVPDANPALSFEGTLTIYCLIGKPPASAVEGIRLNLPGIINFNESLSGENLYIKE